VVSAGLPDHDGGSATAVILGLVWPAALNNAVVKLKPHAALRVRGYAGIPWDQLVYATN
jgi:hypothetical protein